MSPASQTPGRPSPLMRASYLQSNVESLGRLGARTEADIRRRAVRAVEEIERALRTAWLPLQLDIELTDAIEQLAGRDATRELARHAIAVSAEGPLLRPFLRALKAVGLTPHAGFKVAPKAWRSVYRFCGELEVERDDDRAVTLTQHDAPEAILYSEAYQVGIAGALEGVVLLTGGAAPSVEPEAHGPLRRVRYRCTWR